MVIKRVGPVSCAKVFGTLYALLGLIIGAFVSLFAMAAGSLASNSSFGGAGMGALFGVGAIVLLPIFYGIAGFIGGLITSLLYNLVAGFVGGIEIETQ